MYTLLKYFQIFPCSSPGSRERERERKREGQRKRERNRRSRRTKTLDTGTHLTLIRELLITPLSEQMFAIFAFFLFCAIDYIRFRSGMPSLCIVSNHLD